MLLFLVAESLTDLRTALCWPRIANLVKEDDRKSFLIFPVTILTSCLALSSFAKYCMRHLFPGLLCGMYPVTSTEIMDMLSLNNRKCKVS